MSIPQSYRCRKCGDERNRKAFLVEVDGALARDYLCPLCRKRFMPMHQLRNRVKNGLMSEEAFQLEVAIRKKRRAETAAENLERWRMQKAANTWNRALRSAKITLKLLDAMPMVSLDEYRWRKEMRQLVQSMLEEIEELYLKEEAPNARALFWYDVSSDAAIKARAIIAKYPGGKENCPVQIL